MKIDIITKAYPAPPVSEHEIFRYLGCEMPDEKTIALVRECLLEAQDILSYKVCFTILPLTISDNICDFSCFSVNSEKLAKNLSGCESAVIFCATVGLSLDRLILKHSRISPSKAITFQAIGSERVEALCDEFCKDIANIENCAAKPRFSPGYGDLPVSVQKDIFKVLNCQKNIAVFLNDSLLMSPSKSVTAFMGLYK